MAKSMSENEIAIRILPMLSRWPSVEVAGSRAWEKLRECADGLRSLGRATDMHCSAAEDDKDLNDAGIKRRRAALGQKALAELDTFNLFIKAEAAVTRDLQHISEKMTAIPSPSNSVADQALATEIRAHLKAQKNPVDTALKLIGDPRTLSAILNAPCFLSGLSEIEMKIVAEQARVQLHPELDAASKALTAALDDCRQGLGAVRRLILERTNVVVESDVMKMIKENALKLKPSKIEPTDDTNAGA